MCRRRADRVARVVGVLEGKGEQEEAGVVEVGVVVRQGERGWVVAGLVVPLLVSVAC